MADFEGDVVSLPLPQFRRQPVTAGVAGIMLALALLSLVNGAAAERLFALTPLRTMLESSFVWNIITASLLQLSLLRLLLLLPPIVLVCASLESDWGSAELLRFLLVVVTASGVLTFFQLIFLYVFTFTDAYLKSSVYGGAGLLSALLVGLKLQQPDAVLHRRLPWLQVQYLPLALVALTVAAAAAGFPLAETPLVLYCTPLAWFWLRFFHRFGERSGDASEEFQLVTFFPPLLHPVLRPIFNLAFACCAIAGFCRQRQQSAALTTRVSALLEDGFSPSRDAVAERRRARGKRALDEKMAALGALPPMPTFDDPLPSPPV
eukprot:PLAT175.3.p1 GENE.PLAT175.3~~PLAT175.3.p1  ORF type:complete len:334 (-),score=71.06 PLAT175.3:90-1049(-)